MIEQPLVSIIIPTFNRAHLIGETLDSVLAQTYANWECVVVDDGSTDGTAALIQDYIANDKRFLFLGRPNNKVKGASTCRNIGLKEAKGKYIVFFDSDDILLPDVLEARIKCVQNFPDYDFYVFQTIRFFKTLEDMDCIWNDLSKPNSKDLDDFLRLNPVWHTSGPFWSKYYLINQQLCFTEGVSSWQDWEFHIRVLLKSPNYIKIDSIKTLVCQRFHEGESINKLISYEAQQNRIELFFMLITAFKINKRFDNVMIQKQFFKLFYFVIKQISYLKIDKKLWKRLREELYLISNIDFWFWRCLLYFKSNTDKRGYYTILKLFNLFKVNYFSKRFAVEDYSDRTWYSLKIKSNGVLNRNHIH